jgi:hypothetical protein
MFGVAADSMITGKPPTVKILAWSSGEWYDTGVSICGGCQGSFAVAVVLCGDSRME